MKNIIIVLIAVFGTVMGLDAQEKSNEKDIVVVNVEGLGCPFCAYGLEKKIKEWKGVKKFTIDMESGKTRFLIDPLRNIDIEQVENQVKKAGYTPINISIQKANGELLEAQLVNDDDGLATYAADNKEIVEGSIRVNGNCDMCKKRIERAANAVPGVGESDWNKKKKLLTFKFDQKNINKEAIAEAVASAGYDSELGKAPNEKYELLPNCCQYKRKGF